MINDDAAALKTERAIEELRRGRTIGLQHGDRWSLIAAIETLDATLYRELGRRKSNEMTLLITAERGRAIGLDDVKSATLASPVAEGTTLGDLRVLAGLDTPPTGDFLPAELHPAKNRAIADAGIRLAKAGRLIPAVLCVPVGEATGTIGATLRTEDVAESTDDELRLISRARVPLLNAVDTEIVLFRQRYGLAEHLAILIGNPNPDGVSPVRLHSACLTGDVLGSLRCDCGDQLKRAVSRMAALGRGVLLYLDQEGRGIGLANKLRAYALQDAGLDTLDADQHLGFRPDERDYGVAAIMLRHLDIRRIRLLTNNPDKIKALTHHGIDVVGRIPLVSPVNAHNRRYLKAKLDRAGHLGE